MRRRRRKVPEVFVPFSACPMVGIGLDDGKEGGTLRRGVPAEAGGERTDKSLVRLAKLCCSCTADKQGAFVDGRWFGLLTELRSFRLKTRKVRLKNGMGFGNAVKVVIETKIVCLTKRKILLHGMKLFANGDLLLEKIALRFKLRS